MHGHSYTGRGGMPYHNVAVPAQVNMADGSLFDIDSLFAGFVLSQTSSSLTPSWSPFHDVIVV